MDGRATVASHVVRRRASCSDRQNFLLRPVALTSTLTTRPAIAAFRYPPSSIPDLLAAAARNFAGELAIVAPNRAPLTHAALGARLASIGLQLAEVGLGRG